MYKVSVCGVYSCGKTTLCKMLYDVSHGTETVLETEMPTIAPTVFIVEHKGRKFQLVDTCGLERFQAVNRYYVRGSDMILYCTQVTSEKTVDEIERECISIAEETGAYVVPVVTKSDLYNPLEKAQYEKVTRIRSVSRRDSLSVIALLSLITHNITPGVTRTAVRERNEDENGCCA